jgi:hypothetical protein
MARLEAHSGIAWDVVADLVNRPSTDILRDVAVIYEDCGCMLLDFCECSFTASTKSARNEVIEISSNKSLYVTAQNDVVEVSDTASVGSNCQS